jgi:tetratricopeptide (TPR) repeat protein
MNDLRRLLATATLSLAAVALSAPPAAAPTPAPAKPTATEYPLSCNAAAKPLVFKAWDQMINARPDEARDTLKQAIAADPKCVMARATWAMLTPGAEGRGMFDEARGQLSGLSELEKLDFEAMAATRDGDPEKSFVLGRKMQSIAPTVFMVHMNAVHYAWPIEQWEAAEAAALKATEVAPTNGAGWNSLGYAKLNLGKRDEAIAAFRKYVELSPNEPNAHDSLADALLSADQLDEAAAEYQKAVDSSGGKFWVAYTGLATVKALKDDWDGARAAGEKLTQAAVLPADKMQGRRLVAWAWIAQGKLPEAVKVLDAAQKDAAFSMLEWDAAVALLDRGMAQLMAGKYPEALRSLNGAQGAKVDTLTEGQRKQYQARVLAGLVATQARMGKPADAEKTLAALEAILKDGLTGPLASDLATTARGVVALAKKDAKGAVEVLSTCTGVYDACRLTLAEAQEKAGDAAAAAATREALHKANHRDPEYWVVHARAAAAKVPGKKVAADGAKK